MSRQNVFLLFSLLVTTNYVSMVHAAAEAVDPFAQEHAFHERLCAPHDLNAEGVQSYYKRIGPVTSTPPVRGMDQWVVTEVSIGGRTLNPSNNGNYTHGNISFDTDFVTNLNLAQPLNIPVTCAGNLENVELNIIGTKRPMLPDFRSPERASYSAVLEQMRLGKLSSRHYVKLTGNVATPEGERFSVVIEACKKRLQPITLRGMEIVCKQNQNKTQLFFDFVAGANGEVDIADPIECENLGVPIQGGPVVCIKNHKMIECEGKQKCELFDSVQSRNKWVPNASNFYHHEAQAMVSLPEYYIDPNGSETLKEKVVWVFGDDRDGFYQLTDRDPELVANSDHIYSERGSLCLTLPYKATYKDCFSENVITLSYLEKVSKPRVVILGSIERGRHVWDTGTYKKIGAEARSWKNVENPGDQVIRLGKDPAEFDVVWPDAANSLDADESKRWCDAAQLFLSSFSAEIHRCNPELANKLARPPVLQGGEWTHLLDLNMSKLTLENGLTWEAVCDAVGTMTQLQKLDVSNNHPIADLYNPGCCSHCVADRSSAHYFALARCIEGLQHLTELRIQGSWLKRHDDMPRCCCPLGLTGIKAITHNVSKLRHLKALSIDQIKGCLTPRDNNEGYFKTFVRMYGSAIYGIKWPERECQDNLMDRDRYRITEESTYDIAITPLLRMISIYSPREHCVDPIFRERLIEKRRVARAADRTLPALTVTPAVLE